MKRTPLYDCHIRLGAQMTDFGGFEMPVRYSGDKVEHMAVREKVGLFDVSHMGEILIAGPLAEEDINRLLTNDATKMKNGQAFYAAMLNTEGKIIDDVVACKFSAEKFLICVNASNREKDFNWIRENCSYAKDVSDDFAQIAVQGPRALDLVAALSQKELGFLKRYHFVEGKLHLELQTTDAIIARTGYTGEDGFELYVPARDAALVWEALLKVGALWGVIPCGLAARDTLRLEAGMCLYGNDIDEDTTPLEAGLDFVVKLNKTIPFIGQDALQKQKLNGIAKKLCGLRVIGKGIARHGYSIHAKTGERIGIVTSGTQTPYLNQAIALGYVNGTFMHPGTEVAVDIRGQLIPAQIVPIPFYKKATKELS